MQQKLKGAMPHFIAIALFVFLSAVYFYPQFQGLKLQQSDITHFIGTSKEISDFRTKYDAEPLWTNSMFSGMPAYQISVRSTNYVSNLESYVVFKTLASPTGYMALAMIGFYILLLCFGVNPWISIIGAVAFGLSSLNILYIEGGHVTKVHAIALIPPLIGSMLLAYRKNMFRGAILLAFFLSLEIAANHLQMTYYAIFLIVAILLVELYLHIKNKQVVKFAKVSGILVIAVVLGVLPSITSLFTTYEYGKYTTRGKSELTITPKSGNFSTTGTEALSSNYIKEYNFGVGEVWSILIPNVKGGNAEQIGNRKGALTGVNEQYKQMISQQSTYWGEQSFSGGAFYFGVTMFLLFVLGMVFIKDPIKWAFLAITLLSVLLSLKYGFLIDWFIDHFPAFSKFRDTKMILYLVQIAIPFVGILFLRDFYTSQIDKKKLLITLVCVLGVLFLFYVMPGVWFDFMSYSEAEYFDKLKLQYQNDPSYSQQIATFIPELENARINIFKSDVLRSLVFSLLVGGLLYAAVIGKLKKNVLVIAIGILVLIDVWALDKRYLNNEKEGGTYKNWVKDAQKANPIQLTTADNAILASEMSANPELNKKITDEISKYTGSYKNDPEVEKIKIAFRELNFATNYRVLTLNNPFANSTVSYYHKSIGGYHGAKLKKYQELIDFYLIPEYQLIANTLQDTTLTEERFMGVLSQGIPVLNMLNTKYVIANPNAQPITNPFANGSCWLVKQAEVVDSANHEILALEKFDLKTTAIVNKKVYPANFSFTPDSTASIAMVSYLPNLMTYKTKAASQQMAVFSEIYYPEGWDAYIDGKKSEYFPANYALRAMVIPAGEHTVEFKFEPKSYTTGESISKASSIFLVLLIFGWIGMEIFTLYKAKE